MMTYFAGLLGAFIRGPIVGLCVYILVMFFHPPSRWWGETLPGIRWSLFAAIATAIAYWLKGRKGAIRDPIWKHSLFVGYFLLTVWMGIQISWALWQKEHLELVELFIKYLILVHLIYRVVDSDADLRAVLWSYVIGCFYISWVAYTSYAGGRFEDFGGPDIGEANAGALTLVTSVFAAGALFLTGGWRTKLALLLMMPFIVNGMVLTSSRSATLAAAFGGLLFLRFTPLRYRGTVRFLSVLALLGFLALAPSVYWDRMSSLKHAGEDEAVVSESGTAYDTGAGRLVIIGAQMRMFQDNPLGWGHRGTAALSPQYLPDQHLTGEAGHRFRSSHNTFMSFLVEQGLPGALLYVLMVWWAYSRTQMLIRSYRGDTGLRAVMVPALAAVLGCIMVGDLFVDYLKFEPRMWFLALVMVMLRWKAEEQRAAQATQAISTGTPASHLRPGGVRV